MAFKNAVLLFGRPVTRRYFLRTLASYLLVVMLCAIAFIPMSFYIREMVQTERARREFDDCASSMKSLSSQIATIRDTFLYLSTQKGFDRIVLVKGDAAPPTYISMLGARNFLASIRGANSLIRDVVVTFRQNDIVVTSNYVFDTRPSFDALYGLSGAAGAYGGATGSRVTRKLLFKPSTRLLLPDIGVNADVLPMASPLVNILNPVSALGDVTVFLDMEELIRALISQSVLDQGWYEITDADGALLFASAPAETVASAAYARFEIPGEFLHVVIGIPTATFEQYAKPVLRIMLNFLLISLFAGVVVSLHSAARATRPVRGILAELGKTGGAAVKDRDAYRVILKSIDEMLENNSRLSAATVAARDERLGRQLDRLIVGCELGDEPDNRLPIKSALCYAQYRVDGARAQSAGQIAPILLDSLKRMLPDAYILHALTGESFLILAPCESEAEREAFAGLLRTLFDRASALLFAEIAGAVGDLCAELNDISRSFESAKLWYYARGNLEESCVSITPRTPRVSTALTGAGQAELNQLLLAGKWDAACARIRRTFLESGGENAGMEQVFYTVRLTLLTAMAYKGASFPLRRYRPDVTPEENIQELLDAARTLCDSVEAGKRSHNDMLKAKILSLIDERFTDSELYNLALAEASGISEKYLCSFIKEQTGRTVSDLIQAKRVERAHELLVHSEKPIGDIWRLSGFSSHNTFYKTIRRVYGLSPSELRDAPSVPPHT